jgi:hypothetical protein
MSEASSKTIINNNTSIINNNQAMLNINGATKLPIVKGSKLVKIAPAPTASLQAPTVSGNTVNVSPIVK